MGLFDVQKTKVPSRLLEDQFGALPFSILNTITQNWQRRKDEWEALGFQSTEGRDVKRYNATPTNIFSPRETSTKAPVSISEFDPYLCELMYRWFSLKGDLVFDPFAGGSVRGIVANVLGRDYIGLDLSASQVEENKAQWEKIQKKLGLTANELTWVNQDSIEPYAENIADMVFTCPPYYNLEKYSKDPRDLSNQKSYAEFLHKYTKILQNAANTLKDNSFFVIVVSEIRADSHSVANSHYLGFVPDTIHILRDVCGLKYYNEIILENNLGSLPIRGPKYFRKNRKIGRHHQNILVFWKGDLTKIEEKFGEKNI